MLGIVIQLAISWLVVWLFEKGNLNCLGLLPAKKRLADFGLFFIITAACSALVFLLQMLIAKQSWQLNPDISFLLILKGIWFVVKAVLFEELIFRGVLLYVLIKKIGATKAIVISAAAFGIYHWFSHELWGNPVQMAIEFFTSGAMGLVLAYGYTKTNSLYVPVAIHLGWNIVQMVVFSGNTIGEQVFIEVLRQPVVTVSYFSYFIMLLLPIVSCLMINWWMLKKYK
ncbi:MAG: CPBP family intramembrane metalloprotease [Chitinophagaceae bacterium]|nr:CPBP family intramembrane metalloprotease [Chitinophagaceae bacterium]